MIEEITKLVLNDLIEYLEEQRDLSYGVESIYAGGMYNHHKRMYDYAIEIIETYEPTDELMDDICVKITKDIKKQTVINNNRKATKEIAHLQKLKNKAMETLNTRLREIDTYKYILDGNWRVIEAQRLIEEIQIYTNAIKTLEVEQ